MYLLQGRKENDFGEQAMCMCICLYFLNKLHTQNYMLFCKNSHVKMFFFPPHPDSPSPEGKRSASIADGQASTAARGIYKYIHFQVVKTNLPRKAE